MIDDPITRARTVLEQTQSAIQEMPETVAASLTEVLRAFDAALESLREIEKRNSEAEHNLMVQQALLDDRLLRIESNPVFTAWNRLAVTRRNIFGRIGAALSPLLKQKTSNTEYAKWVAAEQARLPSMEHARAVSDAWVRQPTIGIILTIRHGQSLAATLESIQNQVYRNWQLCLVFDETCRSQVLPVVRDFEAKMRDFAAKYQPVHYVAADGSDIAAALNAAADLTAGEYLSFVDEAGTISPFALYYIVEALQSAVFDMVYSDEDWVDPKGRGVRPKFKPDWSPDLLTSCMYMGRLLTIRRAAFQQAGGLRSQYAGAHLHDLVLRMADAPVRVHHLSKVLYHSSIAGATTPDNAAASLMSSAAAISNATARAIEAAVARREQTPAECVPGPSSRTFLVRRKRPGGETTVVICSRTPKLIAKCLASLRATADKAVSQIIVIAHEESGPDSSLRQAIQQAGATAVPYGGAFNFAAMNNLGADLAKTPNLLFLNDDVEATCQEWVELLNGQISRDEVGIAGAVMWYPSHLLQHAGLVVGIADGIGHAGRFVSSSDLWPWLQVTRNVSAVTGACLAIRRDLFRQIGGFDVEFQVNYNDVDLCFRIRERGLAVICVPVPGLIHRECQSRRGHIRFDERYRFHKRWADFLSRPDPYYSPSLTPTEKIALNPNHDPSHRSVFTRPTPENPDRRPPNLST